MRAFQSESRYGSDATSSPVPEKLTPLQIAAQQRSDAIKARNKSVEDEKKRLAELEYNQRIKTLTIDERRTLMLEFICTQEEPVNKTIISKAIFTTRESLHTISTQLNQEGTLDAYKKVKANGKLSVAKYFVLPGSNINTEGFVKVDI